MTPTTVPLDDTHAPDLQSWVDSANDPATDFPVQNLPFGRFRRDASARWQVGVAIGDRVLGLRDAGLADHDDVRGLMAEGPAARRALRHALSAALTRGSAEQARLEPLLRAQTDVELGLPCPIGDYTDFYTGIHHATTVGTLFRPDQPLLPNYKWVPIGYHGRASSIVPGGTAFHRPWGQSRGPEQAEPTFAPSARLDHELEVGVLIGAANPLGEPVPVAHAEDAIFGLVLLNDWSARDLQAWEYQPLGPFLSKNFASTLSPWVVTLEALAPFRAPFERPAGDPAPLPYLDDPGLRAHGAFDVAIEVWLQTPRLREAGQPAVRLSQSNLRDAYWTVSQLVAHHTVNGCNLQPGDLLGSGTLSGPAPEQGGSLLELTAGGKRALTLPNGEQRRFLEDGDTVILRGHAERPGFRRIGFGDCAGTVLPARAGVGGAAAGRP